LANVFVWLGVLVGIELMILAAELSVSGGLVWVGLLTVEVRVVVLVLELEARFVDPVEELDMVDSEPAFMCQPTFDPQIVL
jgi:hypothetical protein